MIQPARARLQLALWGFVALALFVPSTIRGWSLSEAPSPSSQRAGEADLGIAVRDVLWSESATITSVAPDRFGSQASARGRFSLPTADVASAVLLLAALVFTFVVSAIASVSTTGLAATALAPRAPPLLLQPF